MMAVYVYYSTTGELYSWCPSDTDPVAPASVLSAQGLASVSGLPALDATHAWSPSSKTVVTVAAPVAPNWMPSWEFIQCFTSTEAAAAEASTDAQVKRFMLMVKMAPQINLNDPLVQGAVNYLSTIGLVASTRVPQILSGTIQAS